MSFLRPHAFDPIQELARIFDQARREVAQFEPLYRAMESVIIYGAGRTGRSLARACQAQGKKVAFFMDRQPSGEIDGIACIAPEQAPKVSRSLPVIIAVHNPQTDTRALRAHLIEQGFERVSLLQEAVDCLPELSHLWLAPRQDTLSLQSEALTGLTRYADAKSQKLYCAILGFRLLGEALPPPESDQYFPATLPPPPSPLRLADCGAYTGDTLDYIDHHALPIAWAAAFEPDPSNYAQLARRHRGRCMLIPCGVSDQMRMARFIMDGSSSAIASPDTAHAAAINIQLCSLDDCLAQTPINFLKMDIEGAELEAIAGAQKLIQACQPRLAIAGYHHPAHLWQIPHAAIKAGFRGSFHLRTHACNSFETVIYGIEPDAS